MNDMIGIETDKKVLSLGFIGVGWIGRNRMQALVNSGYAEAGIIAEPNAECANEALKTSPGTILTHSAEDVYTNPDIDGIVIATPSAMHAGQSMEALNAGKAVFCQKPLGRTAIEVKDVVAASRTSDKLLAVDLSYRYTKAFSALYNTILNGDIGKIYAVNLIFHNAYGPDKEWFYDINQSGGGCVMDLGVHLIDMALCCLGFPEVNNVQSHLFANGEKLLQGEVKVEDFAKVSMFTADVAAINLECSWNVSAGQDAVIEATFFGTTGGASFKNINGSFYDFVAERYYGTKTEVLYHGEDNWGGRAGVVWAENILKGSGFDPITADEYIKTAEVIDSIYGR
jgi:predicted dehydrogenase